MQYIPCNSALLAQETLFLTQKGTFFAQRSPKSAQIATNLNSRQNSVCSGLTFSSESKLFGGCHPCSRATSATLLWNKGNDNDAPIFFCRKAYYAFPALSFRDFVYLEKFSRFSIRLLVQFLMISFQDVPRAPFCLIHTYLLGII